jgi:hypothetical protein
MWWKNTRDRRAALAVPLESARPTTAPGKPFFLGDGFALSNPGRETIVYSEGERQWSLLARWGVSPPQVGVPRPEVWDAVVPPWLRRRYGIVTSRLLEHSGHTVVFDPDSWYAERLRFIAMDTEGTRRPCPCCDADVMTVEVTYPSGQVALQVEPTQRAVEERLVDGRFEVIRADIPVTQMLQSWRRTRSTQSSRTCGARSRTRWSSGAYLFAEAPSTVTTPRGRRSRGHGQHRTRTWTTLPTDPTSAPGQPPASSPTGPPFAEHMKRSGTGPEKWRRPSATTRASLTETSTWVSATPSPKPTLVSPTLSRSAAASSSPTGGPTGNTKCSSPAPNFGTPGRRNSSAGNETSSPSDCGNTPGTTWWSGRTTCSPSSFRALLERHPQLSSLNATLARCSSHAFFAAQPIASSMSRALAVTHAR